MNGKQSKKELTEIFKEFCKRCKHINEKMTVDIDTCRENCEWYKKMNRILGEF